MQDLSMAMLGYSGIPQETRLMFRTFSQLPDVQLTGLLSEFGPGNTRFANTKRAATKQRNIYNSSLFLIGISGVQTAQPRGRLARVRRVFTLYREWFERFKIAPLDFDALDDAIWRLYFQKSLDPADRENILSQKFAMTNLNLWTFLRRSQLPRYMPPKLNTRGYDFLVTPQPRAMTVSSGTQHIARFHDAIPLTDADMFDNPDVVRNAFDMIRYADPRTIFSCVSEPSEETLLRMFPHLKGRTTTIPNVLPTTSPETTGSIPISEIIRARSSSAGWGSESERTKLRETAQGRLSAAKPFRYILAVSTLEPRKNFTTVVRAWERVRYQNDAELKLIIVGRPGWRYESTLAAMRPRIMEGSLLHLEDVPAVELQALYANAECLVSPSFAEGFGYPPLEAMQCGTPAIVSDIAAHRWSMGDGVLYADPYSVPDIARKIVQLAVADDRETLRRDLRARAARQQARYEPGVVGDQWAQLFARLKRGEAPVSTLTRPLAAPTVSGGELAAAE
jgi:hypothetical protein